MISIEHMAPLVRRFSYLNLVIFHSYVSLPEGIHRNIWFKGLQGLQGEHLTKHHQIDGKQSLNTGVFLVKIFPETHGLVNPLGNAMGTTDLTPANF